MDLCDAAWVGAIRHGLVRFGIDWSDSVWIRAIRHGLEQFGRDWCNSTWIRAVRHRMEQFEMLRGLEDGFSESQESRDCFIRIRAEEGSGVFEDNVKSHPSTTGGRTLISG